MPSHVSNRLIAVRRIAGRGLVVLLWLHMPGFLAAALADGAPLRASSLWPAGLAALAAAVATAIRRSRGDTPSARLTISALLASMTTLSAIVLSADGLPLLPWSLYSNLHGLVCLAALTAYCDWRALAAGILTILVQRAGLGWLQPGWAGATINGTHGLAFVLARSAVLLVAVAPSLWLTREMETLVAEGQAEVVRAREAAAREEAALRLASEAATDLAAQAAEDRVGRTFEHEVGGLVSGLVADAASAAQGVSQAVAQISGVTEETAQRTVAMAEGSQETLASAQEVAASVDRLAASIAQVTSEVREVSEVSFRAMEEAGRTNETVQQLADTAVRIGTVVRMINSIAGRTNLLALNATIEAARAGDAGRGFSVVASEVKDLAHQTARATTAIETEIETIRIEMAHAMAAIDGMAATVANLGGITVSVAGAMDDQAEIARAIAASAMRAATGTESVVANLHVLTEAATRGDKAAREGSQGAERLAEKCTSVETAVLDFMKTLLAA